MVNGAHFLSANNTYYLAIDSGNNIQALPESEIANVRLLKSIG